MPKIRIIQLTPYKFHMLCSDARKWIFLLLKKLNVKNWQLYYKIRLNLIVTKSRIIKILNSKEITNRKVPNQMSK